MKANIYVPVIVLGLPLEDSENPYLTIPIDRPCNIEYNINNTGSRIEIRVNTRINTHLEKYTRNIIENLELENLNIRVIGDCEIYPVGGLYAAVSSFILYKIAQLHSEHLETYELIEYARLYDPIEPAKGWEYVIDSLRYSSAKAKSIVYRNEEEYGELADVFLKTPKHSYYTVVKRQVYTTEDYGTDTYGAIIHTIGTLVLEAAMRVRESNKNKLDMELLNPLITLNNTLAQLFWPELKNYTSQDIVFFSPSINHGFDIVG